MSPRDGPLFAATTSVPLLLPAIDEYIGSMTSRSSNAASELTPSPQKAAAVTTFPWLVAAYASLGVALVAVLFIAARGAYLDFEEKRISLLQAELNRLRSHAVRTVLRIQDVLREGEIQEVSPRSLAELQWLREHWERFIPNDDARLYAAVVSPDGRVLMHSRGIPEGSVVAAAAFQRPTETTADDVSELAGSPFTGGTSSLDISIPILRDEHEIATYHSGFNIAWFDEKVAQESSATRNRWAVAFAIITVVIGAAGLSLLYIARRMTTLQTDVAISQVRRLAEMGQLAGGIAHEVRNPLNAIRLNLHVVQRLLGGASADERTVEVMRETVREMERIDGLLRSLLEYARPERPNAETVDVHEEIRGVVGFMQPLFDRDDVHVVCRFADGPIMANLDRARLRQIVLNLLKNSLEALGEKGTIQIDVARPAPGDTAVEIVIRDDGPGIDAESTRRIFEPFFTTKELGTGLGLTLVKRYLEEAGGEIIYRPGVPRGAVFTLRVPLAPSQTTDAEKSETTERSLEAATHSDATRHFDRGVIK